MSFVELTRLPISFDRSIHHDLAEDEQRSAGHWKSSQYHLCVKSEPEEILHEVH